MGAWKIIRWGCLVPFVYGIGMACATAEDPNELGADAGIDGRITPPGTGSDASSGFDSSTILPPFDSGAFDSSTDATAVDAGACPPPMGTPCDTNAVFPGGCPFFYTCEQWTNPFVFPPVDGGGDGAVKKDGSANGDGGVPGADAGDAGDAAPTDGVCLAVSFGGSGDCNNGLDQCDAGTKCLLAARRCLTPQEAECICENPAYAGACQ